MEMGVAPVSQGEVDHRGQPFFFILWTLSFDLQPVSAWPSQVQITPIYKPLETLLLMSTYWLIEKAHRSFFCCWVCLVYKPHALKVIIICSLNKLQD